MIDINNTQFWGGLQILTFLAILDKKNDAPSFNI